MNFPRPFPPRRSVCRAVAAFTLVELLVVMLVIITLLGLTTPLIRGVLGGRNVSDGLDTVADYLTYARTQAMTQNTYTVVGFYQARGSDDLQIGGVISNKGMFDATQFAQNSPTYNPAYPPLGKTVHVPNVTFVTEPGLSDAMKTKLGSSQGADGSSVTDGISNGSVVDCLSTNPNNASVFSFYSNKTTFGRGAANPAFSACVVVFSPQGEALYFPQAAFPDPSSITISSTMPFYGQLFFGLRTTRNGNVTSDANSAALTLDGGSGSIRTYRL